MNARPCGRPGRTGSGAVAAFFREWQEGGGREHGDRQRDVAGHAGEHGDEAPPQAEEQPRIVVDLELRRPRQRLVDMGEDPLEMRREEDEREDDRRRHAPGQDPRPKRGDGHAGNEQRHGERDVAVLGQRPERETEPEDDVVEPAPALEHPEHGEERRRGQRQREERVGMRMERLPADLRDGEQPRATPPPP